MLDKFGNAVIVQNAYSGARYKIFSAVCLGDAGVIVLQDINAKENDGLTTVSPSEFVKVYFVVNHDRDGNEIKFERYNNEHIVNQKIIKSRPRY